MHSGAYCIPKMEGQPVISEQKSTAEKMNYNAYVLMAPLTQSARTARISFDRDARLWA